MPVPVPVFNKQPTHLVIKKTRSSALDTSYTRQSVFRHLTNSLPLPPSGPPPAFATRQEWIDSLPSWRRNKPRRIWEEESHSSIESNLQGFETGLAVAGDASVIKGAHAQASIPPSQLANNMASTQSSNMNYAMEEDTDDEMSTMDGAGWQAEDMFRFTDEDDDMGVEQGSDSGSMEYASDYQAASVEARVNARQTFPRSYERGAFSPVLEDISDNEPSSSPAGPTTPFADFVDRAVGGSQALIEHARGTVSMMQPPQYCYGESYCGNQCYQCQHCPVQQVAHQPAAVAEPVVTPTASAAYRKLAEPLAEWMVSFVWKVCTTGMSLPPQYAQPMAFIKQYSTQPPSHLAHSVHSMLLSTLLQPSAVFLALWYIVRLPVFFGPVGLGSEHVREMRFRAELLGEAHLPLDRDALESFAPFRLILLGCMLANKWLDDHTFSNKTWHTISNVPIRSLNKLEALALDLFAHDLSIPTDEWCRWLTQLNVYHSSLSSPGFPQPISRPSTSPHNIIHKAIEELLEASARAESHEVEGIAAPVFYDIVENKASDIEQMQDIDVLAFDLDEDGPLREEYMPKRRISSASNSRARSDVSRTLPPPAKWSPAADEPIVRAGMRPQAQYLAPQPISHGHSAATVAPPPAPFHQALDMSRRIWPLDEHIARQSYVPVHAPVYSAQVAYTGYEYTYPPLPAPHMHSRSQSLSYNHSATPGHYRSFSHSQYDHGCGDLGYPAGPYVAAIPHPQWTAYPNRVVYPPVYDSYEYQRPMLKA
ncbi:hypothetical protein BDY19DRAFT_889688 [Irpex rosettiformis]|uniref:Uncharacterized protein n=1 Tax=Irpex rosettiformis TaxID=378272 RepID=A0ACB8U4G9_9APHY|nr:hypothetical protein BDY19DRAFT_889688 [Irpex rosettiformis]